MPYFKNQQEHILQAFQHCSWGKDNWESKYLQAYSSNMAEYEKRVGAYKITSTLDRDYGVHVSVCRVKQCSCLKCLWESSNFYTIARMMTVRIILSRSSIHRSLIRYSCVTSHLYRMDNKWYYLCVIIDLFSRKIIAWKRSQKIDVDLTISTFKLVIESQNNSDYLMFYSARGCQYTAYPFRMLFDNAVVECFLIL